MKRRAKIDAATFILGGKSRNPTNKKNDISTPYLSACVDNKYIYAARDK